MDYEFVNRKGFEINGLDGAKDQLNRTAGVKAGALNLFAIPMEHRTLLTVGVL